MCTSSALLDGGPGGQLLLICVDLFILLERTALYSHDGDTTVRRPCFTPPFLAQAMKEPQPRCCKIYVLDALHEW